MRGEGKWEGREGGRSGQVERGVSVCYTVEEGGKGGAVCIGE